MGYAKAVSDGKDLEGTVLFSGRVRKSALCE